MNRSIVTKLKSRLIAGVSVASVLLVTSGTIAAPQLVLVNANVFTADPVLPYAQAVAIEGGRILAVGSNEQVRAFAGPKTRIIDAGGRLVAPGLIEAHVHLGGELPTPPLAMPNLPFPGPTGEQALAAVEQAAKTRTDWICAYVGPLVARDHRDWRKALDMMAPNTPVFLKGFWGHTTIVNSEGLRRLGITERITDPLGGWWGRDENGRLDGRAYEAAETITPRLRPFTPEYLATAFGAAQQRYARWGVTSIHLMNNDKSLEVTLAGLALAKPAQKWTVYSWGAWQTPAERIPDAWAVIDVAAKQAPAKVRVEGPKWILDGTPIEQNSLQRKAYSNRPGWRGRSNFTDAQLREILKLALERPTQLALHVVGDAETDRLLKMMEQLAPASAWRAKRVRIVAEELHCRRHSAGAWVRRRSEGTKPVSQSDAGHLAHVRAHRGLVPRSRAEGLHRRRCLCRRPGGPQRADRARFGCGPCGAVPGCVDYPGAATASNDQFADAGRWRSDF
jgi:predicted amidohydrolase YtcJ